MAYAPETALDAKSTFMSATAELREQVFSLNEAVNDIADRLCGSIPTKNETAGEGPRPVPNGLLPELLEHISVMTRKVEQARSNLDRIVRMLP